MPTTTLSVKQSISGKVVVSDPLNPQTLSINKPSSTVKFTNGSGAGQLNKSCVTQLVIPPSGADSINLSTGALTGSQTGTLKTPDNATLSLTGLKVFSAELVANGSSSVTIAPATVNGFAGWMGGTTPSSPLVGVNGALCQQARSDASGWVVDGTHLNLVFTNNDAVNAATINLSLDGI